MKSFLRSEFMTSVLGRLIWGYMRLISSTVRWKVYGAEQAKADWSKGTGVVLAAWHSQIITLPTGWIRELSQWPNPKRTASMLVSLSKDGEAVARAVDHLGIALIRGSASNKKKQKKDKGGVRAVAEASRALKSDNLVCITPDGPRGPAEEVSAGVIMIAQRSGAPILPYALATSPRKRLGSWDRFIIPFPFTRGAIVFGPMLFTQREDDPETLQAELQTRLDAAVAKAEEMVGLGDAQRTTAEPVSS